MVFVTQLLLYFSVLFPVIKEDTLTLFLLNRIQKLHSPISLFLVILYCQQTREMMAAAVMSGSVHCSGGGLPSCQQTNFCCDCKWPLLPFLPGMKGNSLCAARSPPLCWFFWVGQKYSCFSILVQHTFYVFTTLDSEAVQVRAASTRSEYPQQKLLLIEITCS